MIAQEQLQGVRLEVRPGEYKPLLNCTDEDLQQAEALAEQAQATTHPAVDWRQRVFTHPIRP